MRSTGQQGSTKTVKPALVILSCLLVAGTIGYSFIEGWSLLDSLYMTIITLSTVGYRELAPLSTAGKLFTSMIIVFGVGTLAYALKAMVETLVERSSMIQRRMHMGIKRMSDHVIVCGYGRMGRTVVERLVSRGTPTVVIEKDAELIESIDPTQQLYVQGDATEDSVLVEAGVERAKALATVLSQDADNLFVTLTARGLNPRLIIISRAMNAKSEAKMLTAGATRVLNPYASGGRLMVRQLLEPSVTEFIDEIQEFEDPDICLEEIQVEEGSSLAGTMLKDSPIRRQTDVLVVGIRHGDQRAQFNPPADAAPQAGDTLLVLGKGENLRRLEQLALGHRRGGS